MKSNSDTNTIIAGVGGSLVRMEKQAGSPNTYLNGVELPSSSARILMYVH